MKVDNYLDVRIGDRIRSKVSGNIYIVLERKDAFRFRVMLIHGARKDMNSVIIMDIPFIFKNTDLYERSKI